MPNNANKKQSNETQTDVSGDFAKIADERNVFEVKYRKTARMFNMLKSSLEEYQKKYVVRASEVRALTTALNRFDNRNTLLPIEEIDQMYQEGYEDWKRENPEFVARYKL